MARRHKPRRGVVLLIVLILLTLLMVIGLTFAVISGQFRRGAEAAARTERYTMPPEKLLDRAMYQLVRDTERDTDSGASSAVTGHSLLADLYGNESVAGILTTNVQQHVDGQFLELKFFPLAHGPLSSGPFSRQPGFYNGSVLTFTNPTYGRGTDGEWGVRSFNDDGLNGDDDPGEAGWPGSDDQIMPNAAQGNSVRIVRYVPPTVAPAPWAPGTLLVEAVDGDLPITVLPAIASRFVVNGRPFNGTGAGFKKSNQSLDASLLTGEQTALLPNYGAYRDLVSGSVPDPSIGGMDESYDAVDYQNMFLAMVPPNTTLGIIPSFHRPELVNYWLKRFATNVLSVNNVANPEKQVRAFRFAHRLGVDMLPGTPDDPLDDSGNPIAQPVFDQIIALKRKIILRPLPEDHPDFANRSSFAKTMGWPGQVPGSQQLNEMRWDVDNDGDGIPDSIWIDVGMPVQTDSSGRRYRPMVAILCNDLDGKLNVNAHSSPAHLSDHYASGRVLQEVPLLPSVPPLALPPLQPPYAGAPSSLLFPRGLGYGPADIFLGQLFSAPGDFRNILAQRYLDNVINAAGMSNTDDLMSAVKCLGIPRNYANWDPNSYVYSSCGTPPDLWGRGATGLDYNGRPVRPYMGEAGETVADPYEIVLNRNSAGFTDAPFTAAELERLLRWNDVDAFSLPERLLRTAPNTFMAAADAPRRRSLVTTNSSHLSVPTSITPKQFRGDVVANSVLELVATRLQKGGATDIQAEMQKMVPWEVWHGQPLNLNRWFGNGRDDSVPANGVVDEPNEADDAGEIIWPEAFPGGFGTSAAFPSGVPFNYANDDPVFTSPTQNRYARQIFARHMYCMMMFLADQQTEQNSTGYVHPTQEALPPTVFGYPTPDRELTALRIAQWAINTVDFRDSDAIMTPFEYDVDPFNGWQDDIDGNPSTPETGERRMVWGAEYPDLLLTETGAFHDRRVKDTNHDDDTAKKRTDMNNPDDDLDQYQIPQGSLFVELYCTHNDRYERKQGPPAIPPEITREVPPQELYDRWGRLDLGRLAPRSWRGVAPHDRDRRPVWRLAISVRHPDPSKSPNVLKDPAVAPDSTSFEPINMTLLPGVPEPLSIERYVWFTPLNPDLVNDPDANATFYGQFGGFDPAAGPDQQCQSNVLLATAQYAVIGPRQVTSIGSAINGPDGDPATYDPSTHRLEITDPTTAYPDPLDSAFVAWDNSAPSQRTAPPAVPVQPALGLVIAANPPRVGQADAWQNQARRIGVNISEPLPQSGTYYQEFNPTDDPEWVPFDAYDDLTAPMNTLPDQPLDENGPLASDPDGLKTGTRLDYKTVFLQRLADPLVPWNPPPKLPDNSVDPLHDHEVPVNPYITVDWAAVDLTVFSGEEDTDQEVLNANGTEWIDPTDKDPYGTDPTERFAARERGDADCSVWGPDTVDPAETTTSGNPDNYFKHSFAHTLSYLNQTMGVPTTYATLYEGAPAQPFPWLAWNNRPYANPLELMQVPSSTPARLLHEFDIVRATTTSDPYDSDDAVPMVGFLKFKGTFPHLLNFFHSSEVPLLGAIRRGADFYRIFDYVDTPSPFVGAEKWYYPVKAASDLAAFSFRPPFNYLSRFRDPGRININTVFDLDVWEGLTKGYPLMDPTALGAAISGRVFASRQGYSGSLLSLNSDYPTVFGNPFRAADSADLVPIADLRKKEPVQATLLRENIAGAPLFVPDRNDSTQVPPEVLEPCQNQDRNPFFRYQGLSRLSNLVSYNSNVFAVWITVGYFEVQPNGTVDAAHPDGYQLSRELGEDNGTVKRHRAFYIIDRSIPVAFEPGENHNVDRAVLLRRFIE